MTDLGSRLGIDAPARDRTENAITPLRLALAVMVVFSHAWPIGGFGRDELYHLTGQMQLGTVAVIGFFGLSGFLLARSRLTSSLVRYARRRALRILPGLWVCVAVIAIVTIPLAVGLGGRASADETGRYVATVLTFQPLPVDIPGLYPGSGVGFIVDAPLWTLPWEIYLYALLGIVGIGGARLMRTTLPALLMVFVIANAAMRGTALELYGQLPVAFLTGSCIYAQAVPIRRGLAAACLIVSVVAAMTGQLAIVGPVTLAYLALYLGMRLPWRWTFDMSFGVYIYGWPVQSLLAEAGAARLGLLPFFGLTLAVVLPIAALSARLIEMPALRLGSNRAEPGIASTESGPGAVAGSASATSTW